MRQLFFSILFGSLFFNTLAQSDTALLNQIKKSIPSQEINAVYFTKNTPYSIHIFRSQPINTYPYQYCRDNFLSSLKEKEDSIKANGGVDRDIYFYNRFVLPRGRGELILKIHFPRRPSESAFGEITTIKNGKKKSQINSLNLIAKDELGTRIYGQFMIANDGTTILYSSYRMAPQNQYQRIDIEYQVNKHARLIKQKIIVYRPQCYSDDWFYTKNIWDGDEVIEDILIGKKMEKYAYIGDIRY